MNPWDRRHRYKVIKQGKYDGLSVAYGLPEGFIYLTRPIKERCSCGAVQYGTAQELTTYQHPQVKRFMEMLKP